MTTTALTWAFIVERVTGIEPALQAWEARVLPLNYTRDAAPDMLTDAAVVVIGGGAR